MVDMNKLDAAICHQNTSSYSYEYAVTIYDTYMIYSMNLIQPYVSKQQALIL